MKKRSLFSDGEKLYKLYTTSIDLLNIELSSVGTGNLYCLYKK